MDQKRFDNLTRTLASGSSRRKVLGGALAGVIGAGIAAVSGTAAKGKKNRKKGNGRVGAEFTCTAANANVVCDNQSCCASTAGGLGPICVTEGTQRSGTQQFCGDENGAGVCRTCPPGTVCSEDQDGEIRCICTPSTCPTGCCINNDDIFQPDADDECVQNGSGAPVNSANPDFDGNSVCGFGGSECTICSIGTIFAGCCTPTGACNAGTTGISCGSGGNICEPCPAGSNCINQTCETTAPCGPATCGAGCCSGQACLSGTSNGACGEGGGACQVCGAGATCVNHQCVAQPTCPPGLTDCNGICVNLQVDKANCGACGNACGGSQRCRGGVCKKKKMMMMMN